MSGPEASGYFAAAEQAWDRAQAGAGQTTEYFYGIGGQTVRLVFAGDALVHLTTTALAHLALPPVAKADLTIHLWDSFSTGAFVPPPGQPATDPDKHEIRLFNDDRHSAVYQADSQSLSIVDFENDRAFFQAKHAAQIPSYEHAFPLRTIFHQWFHRRGLHLTHAAAVGNANGAVLLTGRGGSGKSTSALACLRGGLDYLGDDYTLVQPTPTPTVHSLYASAKLNADNLHRFPEMALSNPALAVQEKALFFLHASHGPQLVATRPIRAILLPRVTGLPETRLVRVSPVLMLKALAPSTILQLPGTGEATFRALAQLVQSVPTYQLEAGTNLGTVPAVITDFLKDKKNDR